MDAGARDAGSSPRGPSPNEPSPDKPSPDKPSPEESSPEETDAIMDQPSPARRTVLIGAGAAAVALTAAACGSDTGRTPAPAETTLPGTGAPDPDSTGTDTTGTASAALTTVDAVPVGSGTVVGDVVVTQPTAGDFQAFSTRCPHQGCAVAVAGAELDCPCHHSRFSLTGAVEAGPATSGLTPVAVRVEGTDIVRA